MNPLFCVTLAVLVCKCLADTFYASDSGVVELTDDNFNRTVIQSDDVWLVKFYAPWCRYSRDLRTEYSKAALAMKGFAKVGAVDTDENTNIKKQYRIKGIPLVAIFVDKHLPTRFSGDSTSPAINITNEVIEAIKLSVSTKLNSLNTTLQESSTLSPNSSTLPQNSSTLHQESETTTQLNAF